MSFVTKTGARALVNVSLAIVTPISGLIHAPIWSKPDPASLLAQATGSSSIAGINHHIAAAGLSCGMGMPPRNIPNFSTANSLATIDKLTLTECSSGTSIARTALADIVTPTWKPENVRHTHDLEWRTRWLSIQRLGSSPEPNSTGTRPTST